MSTRIQVVLENSEKEAFRAAARREGVSLSAWIKGCAQQALEAQNERRVPASIEELRVFFDTCDEVERGAEPDWHEHKHVILGSATSGSSDS